MINVALIETNQLNSSANQLISFNISRNCLIGFFNKEIIN